jgi:hypothetical protein
MIMAVETNVKRTGRPWLSALKFVPDFSSGMMVAFSKIQAAA